MLIKVCGITESEQAETLENNGVDLVGAIFYDKSPRCAVEPFKAKNKVGVFVDASVETIQETALAHELDNIQLHGSESPEMCRRLKSAGYQLIKAIPVENEISEQYLNYEGLVDYILFDTASKRHGGTGRKFSWSAFDRQLISMPFILSGGISENDLAGIRHIEKLQPNLAGIDINSRFEIDPGIKDLAKIKTFIKYIRNHD